MWINNSTCAEAFLYKFFCQRFVNYFNLGGVFKCLLSFKDKEHFSPMNIANVNLLCCIVTNKFYQHYLGQFCNFTKKSFTQSDKFKKAI